ncbi:hypothetical protein [Streptomyces nigra]|uniref:hypothetical protein n=1 Tax=Streptomyces nigra TaxID=1827580 RepID=UPI00371AC890
MTSDGNFPDFLSGEKLGRFIQLASGALMLAVGALLAAYAPFMSASVHTAVKVSMAAIGSLLTLIAGVIFSWVITATTSKRDAQQDVNEKLDSVSRNLAVIYGRIIDAVEMGQVQAYPPETTLALVSQAANMINGQVTEIQAIRGDEFSGGVLVETKNKLDELAQILSKRSDGGQAGKTVLEAVEVRDLRDAIDIIRRDVSRLQGARPSTHVTEEVACPNCGALSSVMMGASVGSTTATHCDSCDSRFNVHRKANLSVFTRLPGATGAGYSSIPKIHIACPRCQNETDISFNQEEGDTKLIACTKCKTGWEISLPGGEPKGQKDLHHISGEIVGKSSNQPVTKCPDCGDTLRCALRDPARTFYFALCREDRNLIEISQDVFDVWKVVKV